MGSRMKSVLLIVAAICIVSPLAASAQQPSPVVATKVDEGNRLGGFHVVLLLADTKPGPAPENMTPAVLKALKDVQDLLPFKSFQLLDAALVRGAQGTTRVSGPMKAMYALSIFGRSDLRALTVSLRLTSPGSRVVTSGGGIRESRPAILNTSFRMSVGETLVAGTSRLAGSEQALVVVLTALPESAMHK